MGSSQCKCNIKKRVSVHKEEMSSKDKAVSHLKIKKMGR